MLIATITTQRSGSKLLASCFNSGLETKSLGEIFNPDAWRCAGNFHQFIRAQGSGIAGSANEQILDEYFDGIRQVISQIIHFDIMYNQMEIPCLSWNSFDVPFIVGYLMSRRSIIISLERDPLETYVSSRYLELAGPSAHVLNVESKQDTVPGFRLNVDEYARYRKSVLRQRASLREAMGDYPYFLTCHYEEIARDRKIPDPLRDLIEKVAAERAMRVNGHLLQVVTPRIYKSGVDYAQAFTNLDELKELHDFCDTSVANDRGRRSRRKVRAGEALIRA